MNQDMQEASGTITSVTMTPATPDVIDAEIQALRVVGAALVPLTAEARGRVIRWVMAYFNAPDFSRGY
jgi:hypothetical protein